MRPQTLWGMVGVIGVWLTAGLALPLVNILKVFEPTQLMVFRGLLIALICLLAVGFKRVLKGLDRYTYLIALILPFATLGLYQGIRHWGAGPTIIIITATPMINLIIGVFLGRRVSRAALIGFCLMLTGVTAAQWGGQFSWEGFVWSAFGTLLNGILYELFIRARSSALQKCFWGAVGTIILGMVSSINADWLPILESSLYLAVFFFAFVGGFLYWIANVIAFQNLPTNEASVLVQGETPAVMLGAYILLGEKLNPMQWIGVTIALCGAYYLLRWLTKQEAKVIRIETAR